MVRRGFTTPVRFFVLLGAVAIVAGSVGSAPPPASASTVRVGIGSTAIATAASGGRTIYVSPSGSDFTYEYKAWYNGGSLHPYERRVCLDDPTRQPSSQLECPEPTIDQPLKTIETAVRIAKAGDVIVARGGVYPEAVGWGARPGTSVKPIVMQSYPGERVEVNGTLILKSADYWTVSGIRFSYNAAIQHGQAVVAIAGGNGWTFSNNEVSGSKGVANLLVVPATAANTTVEAKTIAAPRNYTIRGNCIRNNTALDAHGTDHNIYLMSSIYSVGGLIERNLIAGAPRGANIKAAASSASTANDSPRNVVIRYNTMIGAASGVTIGLKAEGIAVERNIIAIPSGSQQYDGGVKTYQLANPGRNGVKDTLISGYTRPISEDYGVTTHIFTARLNTTSAFTYTGSIKNCTVKPASLTITAKYGQYAGL